MQFASLPVGTALRLMLPFGFGFFLSMFTRALSNIVKQPVQLELGLGEGAVSLALGASFFLAFGLAQLPVGVLLDRYDPRRVNASLFLLAALGAVVMAQAQGGAMLGFGRVLMGVGFAGGLMASFKAYAMWFPRERLPTVNSLQFMIGVLGAWSSTKPTELLLRSFDWREVYLLFAAVTLFAAVLVLLLAPRHDGEGSRETLRQQLRGLAGVFRSPYFLRIAPWMCLSMGVGQGINTLYIIPWLTDVAGYPVSRAASGAGWIMLVSAANFALLGPLVEACSRRGLGPMFVPVIGQTGAMALMCLLALQLEVAVIPQWMLWTMLSGTSTLAFAALSQHFDTAMVGRVYTAFNLLGFLVTAAVQWTVGMILDAYPPGPAGGAGAAGYQAAFLALAALQLAGACWYALASWRARQQGTST